MIYFNFAISNPWSKRTFKTVFSRHWTLSKNKVFEVDVARYSQLLGAELSVTPVRCDHAGVHVSVTFLTYTIAVSFYDCRHWDKVNNCWIEYVN
jgi:hypothetical protein